MAQVGARVALWKCEQGTMEVSEACERKRQKTGEYAEKVKTKIKTRMTMTMTITGTIINLSCSVETDADGSPTTVIVDSMEPSCCACDQRNKLVV